VGPKWTNQLAMVNIQELKPLLDDLQQLKAEGLTGTVVAISFCHHLIHPLQERAHPAFEYWGQHDTTWVAQRKPLQGGSATRSAPRCWGYTALLNK
jgi:hypothetical protein